MKKLAVILFFLVGAGLLEACLLCQCRDVVPFFDFFTVSTTTISPAPGISPLSIRVAPDSLEYLAGCTTNWQFTTAAYGCSCEENGERGPKYPITQLAITADRAFTDSLPAGANLNHLFILSGSNSDFPVYTLDAIGQLQYWDYGFYPYGSGFVLQSDAVPDSLGVPFQFTLSITKSNGATVVTTTRPIAW